MGGERGTGSDGAIASAAATTGRSSSSRSLPNADFPPLRAHGFSDEDIWDIGAIAAFFALSNRMANLIDMRPNDEFHLLGRVPKG